MNFNIYQIVNLPTKGLNTPKCFYSHEAKSICEFTNIALYGLLN